MPDYVASAVAWRRTGPHEATPDTGYAARAETWRPFDVLEMPGDHDRWETFSCDWSLEQQYEARRMMGIAARLGNQWAMTQYGFWRLYDLTYRQHLAEMHPVLRRVQDTKYGQEALHRIADADAALSLAEDLGVGVDRDRLLWLAGPGQRPRGTVGDQHQRVFGNGRLWQL